MTIIPSALILSASLLMPVADEVPNFNVASSCKASAQIVMVDSQSYDSCMKEENAARDELQRSWSTFPGPDRASCAAESSGDNLPSYVELLVCLQIAKQIEPASQTQLKGARRKKN
jgi:hypothetical protein